LPPENAATNPSAEDHPGNTLTLAYVGTINF